MAALACGALLLGTGYAGQRRCSLIVDVPRAGDTGDLTLRIAGAGYRTADVPAPRSGSAEFPALPCGEYHVWLSAGGRVLSEAVVTLADGDAWVHVSLPAAAGTVSVQQLRLARTDREFGKALDALGRDDWKDAEAHLQKVVRADEAHAEAHNDLGVCYMRTGRNAEALQEFEKAIQLNPTPAVHLNHALALMQARRWADSEAAARQALRLDPGLARAHFVLGVSLFNQRRDLDRALAELRQSAPSVPRARIEMAALLLSQGRQPEAIRQLRKYLASGEDRFRAEVERTLRKLDGYNPK